MSQDLSKILRQLDSITESLNPQQRSVKQMPADFEPKSISVLGANKDPEHPAKGFFVGGESAEQPYEPRERPSRAERDPDWGYEQARQRKIDAMSDEEWEAYKKSKPDPRTLKEMEGASVDEIAGAIIHRLIRQHPALFRSHGIEAVEAAVMDVASFHEGAEELGTSDVSGMVREVVRQLGEGQAPLAEDATNLNVGDPVIITGNVEFKGKTGDIDSFGQDNRFVVVNLYNYGKHSFHSSDVSYNVDADDDEGYDDDEEGGGNEFWFALYDEDENTTFVGNVYQGDRGWQEGKGIGRAPYNWGHARYMSYLSPDDVMTWIEKDYGRHHEIRGPFGSQQEAMQWAEHNFGPLDEAKDSGSVKNVAARIQKAFNAIYDMGDSGLYYLDMHASLYNRLADKHDDDLDSIIANENPMVLAKLADELENIADGAIFDLDEAIAAPKPARKQYASNSFASAVKKSEQARQRIEKKKERMRKQGFSDEQIAKQFDEGQSLKEDVMDTVTHPKHGKLMWLNHGGSHMIARREPNGSLKIFTLGDQGDIAKKWAAVKHAAQAGQAPAAGAQVAAEGEQIDELSVDTIHRAIGARQKKHSDVWQDPDASMSDKVQATIEKDKKLRRSYMASQKKHIAKRQAEKQGQQNEVEEAIDSGPGKIKAPQVKYGQNVAGPGAYEKRPEELAKIRARKAADAQQQRDAKKARNARYAGTAKPKISLDAIWNKIEDVVGQTYPDGDPIDWLIPWFERQGVRGLDVGELLRKAARKHGYKDLYDYWHSFDEEYGYLRDRLYGLDEDAVDDFLARGGRIQHGKYHKPRKAEKWQGSAHIGKGDAGGKAGQQTGRGANVGKGGVSGKPVVGEAKGLNKRVRVVKTGQTGTIGEVRHGLYKGAPKEYTIDLDGGGNIRATAKELRLIKDKQVNEISKDTMKSYLRKANDKYTKIADKHDWDDPAPFSDEKERDYRKLEKGLAGLERAQKGVLSKAVKDLRGSKDNVKEAGYARGSMRPTGAEADAPYGLGGAGLDTTIIKNKKGKEVGEISQGPTGWYCHHYASDHGSGGMDTREQAIEELRDIHTNYLQNKGVTKAPEFQGVEEGLKDTIKRGVKSVKRGLQGWGDNYALGEPTDPKNLVKRNKAHDDETVKRLAKDHNPGFPFGSDKTTSPHSPRGLQKRVLDREIKKRGLEEAGYDPSKQYGVRYKVFAGREGRLTTKEAWFKTPQALERGVERIQNSGNFYEIDGYSYPQEQDVSEGAVANEEVLSSVKKKVADFLGDIAAAVNGGDLSDKSPASGDQITSAVKTITTDDGHVIKITGSEDDGFRISIKNKQADSTFESLEEAVMACEMYCAHRRSRTIPRDYMEEQ